MAFVVEREVSALGNSSDCMEPDERDDGCTIASQFLCHHFWEPTYHMLSAMIVTNPLF